MKYIVDRIEENILVCEDEEGNIINIPNENNDINIKEGDVISYENGVIKVLETETKSREEIILELTNDIWEN